VSELLAEELRRLDPDEVYSETLTAYARAADGNETRSTPVRKRAAGKTAARKAAARKGTARKTTARKTATRKTATRRKSS
jgi:hypothetical protein